MGKKIGLILFLILGLYTLCLVIQLNTLLGTISGNFGYSHSGAHQIKRRIAFIYQNDSLAFWNEIRRGATAAANGERVYVNFMEVVHGRELQLADYIHLAIEAHYDGIIVKGDDEGIIPLIQEAWNNGIPTLTIVSDLPGSERLGYVGTDNYRAGYVAGKTLMQSISWSSKPSFVILSPLTGVNTQMSVAESIKVFGFREAISLKETTIPIWEKANPTLMDSMFVVRSLLRKYPKLNGIYATYPEGTLAAAKVVLERNATDRIKIIGSGDLPLIREYLQTGVVIASIVEYPYRMGHTAVKEMARYFRESRMNISNNIDAIFLKPANLKEYKEGKYR